MAPPSQGATPAPFPVGMVLSYPVSGVLSRNRPVASAGFQATVSDITVLGNNVHVVAHTGSGEPLAVRLPFGHEAISGLNRGDLVHLAFDPASAQVFC